MTCAQPRDIPFGTLGNRVLHVLLPASHPQCSLNPRGDDWGIGEPVCERRPTLLADAPTLLPSGTEGGKGTEAATLASRRASRARPSSNRACSNLVAPEMRLIHISMPLNHPVLSRIALLPPLCPSVRFDQIFFDRCLNPHMCLSSDVFRILEQCYPHPTST